MNCDEKLTVTFSNNERMKYGKAIIAVSARARAFSAPALYFSGNSKKLSDKTDQKNICTWSDQEVTNGFGYGSSVPFCDSSCICVFS